MYNLTSEIAHLFHPQRLIKGRIFTAHIHNIFIMYLHLQNWEDDWVASDQYIKDA